MQRLLARVLAVVLLCDLAVVAVRAGRDDRTAAAPASPTTAPTTVLAPDQAVVTGTAVVLTAEAEVTGTIAVPFSVVVDRPGAGRAGATIREATVDGGPATIDWDSGRPLDVSGDAGGLDLGPAHVEVTAEGVTWALDGTPRGFVPGRYRIATTVAVGRAGLATPRSGVTFVADEATTMTTRGGAVVVLAPRPVRLEGPGQVSIEGDLTVGTGRELREVASITFGPGPFLVDLEPAPGGWRLRALLQGPVATRDK